MRLQYSNYNVIICILNCVSKKWCHLSYINLLYEVGHYFLDTQ